MNRSFPWKKRFSSIPAMFRSRENAQRAVRVLQIDFLPVVPEARLRPAARHEFALRIEEPDSIWKGQWILVTNSSIWGTMN